MPREEEWFAPVVRIKSTGRYVCLLAWERDKHGQWQGHVAWLARKYHWRGVDVWMRAADLEQVKGAGLPADSTQDRRRRGLLKWQTAAHGEPAGGAIAAPALFRQNAKDPRKR